MNTIGERIRKLRTDRDMTLEELGRSFGGGKELVHRYETGKIKNIPDDKILAMARALNVDPAYLRGYEDEPATKSSEVDEIAEKLHKDPNLRMLFDLADGADPEDLQMVAGMLRRFKENR